MKRLFVIMVWLASGLWTHAATNAVPSGAAQEQLLMEAVLLRSQGFYAEAEGRLKRLAEWQPNQPTIRELLHDVQGKLKLQAQDPVAALKRKLAAITFPSVQFRDANPQDVIEFIRQEVGKLSPDKDEINFVWQIPSGVAVPPITLNLKNIPLPDVLTYVTQLTGLRYRVDAYAVVIYKPEPVTPANVKPE